MYLSRRRQIVHPGLNYSRHIRCFLRRLRRPDPLDCLDETDISRLKLVESQTDHNSGGVETPSEKLAGTRGALLGHVIGDDVLEASV